ncbi:hypothetical protein ACE6H2_017878 [Prunus campanulata]
MASFLHKLNKNTPSLRTVTSLKTHLFPKPTPSVISHHSHLGHPKPECSENQVPHLGPSSFHNVETSNSFPIFPNFPFGYCMNPISSTGFEQLGAFEAVEVESDDARTIWADSVKKKRKKKMNKHKYKKLRKRLRRNSHRLSMVEECMLPSQMIVLMALMSIAKDKSRYYLLCAGLMLAVLKNASLHDMDVL